LIRREIYLSLVKRLILGGVDETIGAWLHSGRSYDLTSMADPLADLILKGIGTPERPQPGG
jgi:TetR/AcrR family fatty acid metabolism transcriptional regulator